MFLPARSCMAKACTNKTVWQRSRKGTGHPVQSWRFRHPGNVRRCTGMFAVNETLLLGARRAGANGKRRHLGGQESKTGRGTMQKHGSTHNTCPTQKTTQKTTCIQPSIIPASDEGCASVKYDETLQDGQKRKQMRLNNILPSF